MTHFATSKDGTRIALDSHGRGTPVVFVSGIFPWWLHSWPQDRSASDESAADLRNNLNVESDRCESS